MRFMTVDPLHVWLKVFHLLFNPTSQTPAERPLLLLAPYNVVG